MCSLRYGWVLLPLQALSERVRASERAYAGAAARCCHQSSLYSLCFGVWLLVPLQGASVRVLFALWSFVASAARCRVLLEGCAVRELFALWSLVRAPASLRATPNASLQATSRNHTLLKLWTLTLGNTTISSLWATRQTSFLSSLLDSAI